jgi:D-3-phosphoglycerate dehydrogenase
MIKVLFIDSNHHYLHEELIRKGFQCDLFWDKPKDELVNLIPEYDCLVIRSKFKINAELIDKAIKLKCIARAGAGMENIDVDYAQQKGIVCVHAPEGNRDAVGEHAVAMLLNLFNNINRADREVRSGNWNRESNRGVELKGKTVGIIGYGNMGSSFAECLRGFSCNIMAFDKYKTGFGNQFMSEVSLDQLKEKADVISIHTPLTDETHYMLNNDFFNTLKKPAYIINTARGKCLKTSHLVEQMKSGKILGACLDVLEYETVSFEQINNEDLPEPFQFLISSDKVILTPHIAGWTHESNIKIAEVLAKKICSVFN